MSNHSDQQGAQRTENNHVALDNGGEALSRRGALKGMATIGMVAVGGVAASTSAAAAQSLDITLQNFDPSRGTVDAHVGNLDLGLVDVSNVRVSFRNVHVNNIRILSHNHHNEIRVEIDGFGDEDVLSATVSFLLDGVEYVGSDDLDI